MTFKGVTRTGSLPFQTRAIRKALLPGIGPSDLRFLSSFSAWPLPATACRGYIGTRMATNGTGGSSPDTPSGFLARTLFNSDHKVIGLNYLWLALFSVFLGLAMSLLIRIHLVWPAARLPFLSGLSGSLERYAALTTLHGSLMVFLVLTAAPQAGFGSYFLPLQIGAREMAFPKLNLLCFWATVASVLGITGAFLVAPATGITMWIAS